MSTIDALNDMDNIQKRYESGISLYTLTREYKADFFKLRDALVLRGVKIRTKTEALQKYVKYSKCIICGKNFRMRPKWDDTTNHHKKTCGDPDCLFKLRSETAQKGWSPERKQYMSGLFTGRDTSNWNTPQGADRYNWKGGISSPVYRRIAFEEYGMEKKCMQCASIENIDVHHKDKNRKNNTRENLEVLCDKCHERHHVKNGDNGWSIYNKRYVPKIGINELTTELKLGKSIRTICKEYHTDHHTLGRMMKKHGITLPKKEILITVDQIKQYLLEGKSVRWMNREYGISSHTLIPDLIKSNNIDIPRKYMKPVKYTVNYAPT